MLMILVTVLLLLFGCAQYLYVPALNINSIADPATCSDNAKFLQELTGVLQDGSIKACNEAFKVGHDCTLSYSVLPVC
jgi:hypothetical protein